MKKNILVIGGSYFVGRVFTMTLSKEGDYNVHLLNRGTYRLSKLGIEEHICDRNDIFKLKEVVPPLDYHAVIDFCAYSPNEINTIIENLPGTIKQYIYVSTCSVYETTLEFPKTENSPQISVPIPGPAGDYAYNKHLLELETQDVCQKYNIPFTILRPAFIYGPFNYAPRESYFFKLILADQPIPVPDEPLALFQFVYATDIARIIMACLSNENVYNNSFNLSAPELICYDRLIEVLTEVCGQKIKPERKSIDQINRDNIPLPFPLDQHEIYSGSKIANLLDFKYTSFVEGMKKTFAFYKKYKVSN